MSGPSSKPKREAPKKVPVFVPHPKSESDVRAGYDEAERGELLSAEESSAYVRELLGETRSGK